MTHLFLTALTRSNNDRPPVWFMRQAGRFLPEYRALRQKHSLWDLFHTPELAALVTQMPLKTLGVDAAILFSDILTVTEMLGYRACFPEKGSPFVELTSNATTPIYVAKTIELLKPSLSVPLIGFCGGPYTVAKYMHQINHSMLKKLLKASIDYVQMQVDAGADVIQIFDSWAGLLPRDEFHDLCLRYLEPLVASISVPVIVFCRGSCRYVKELVSLNPAAISFDSERSMQELRDEVPPHIAVQGNLSPEVFRGPLSELEKEAEKLLSSMKGEKGFIVNLGHGVLPDTPVENGVRFVEMVKRSNDAIGIQGNRIDSRFN